MGRCGPSATARRPTLPGRPRRPPHRPSAPSRLPAARSAGPCPSWSGPALRPAARGGAVQRAVAARAERPRAGRAHAALHQQPGLGGDPQ
eukprot:11213651-Lingulodinium_polyedra.AAC.1